MVNNFFADDSIFGEVLENKQQEEALSSSVDLQGIFGVIYDLFSRLGILNVTEENTTGISLKFEYPDSKFSDETISAVIFDIEQRKRLVYQTSAGLSLIHI